MSTTGEGRSSNSELHSVLAQIKDLSKNPEHATHLRELLAENSTLISHHAKECIEQLSIEDQSIACLYIVYSWKDNMISLPNAVSDVEWVFIARRFLIKCDANQLEGPHDNSLILSISRGLKKDVMLMNNPRLGILPLLNSIKKTRSSPDLLTALHADFFQLCLMAKNYSAAKELLLEDVYEMDVSESRFCFTDFLLYCYYGGRLCIGLKWYKRALQLFSLALTAPSLLFNAITFTIYKYYMLVSVLKLGKVPELPRYTSNAILRLVREGSLEPYYRLADAYKDADGDNVRAVAANHKEVFEEDKCMGLVMKIVDNVSKRDIKSLTKCYLTRPLKDIAGAIGMDEIATERKLLQLMKEREISIKISCSDSIVSFLDDDYSDDIELATKIETMLKDVMDLGERMEEIEDKLELDPEYRKRVLQAKQHSKLDC